MCVSVCQCVKCVELQSTRWSNLSRPGDNLPFFDSNGQFSVQCAPIGRFTALNSFKIKVNRIKVLTSFQCGAEDVLDVLGRAVPALVAELVLALLDAL